MFLLLRNIKFVILEVENVKLAITGGAMLTILSNQCMFHLSLADFERRSRGFNSNPFHPLENFTTDINVDHIKYRNPFLYVPNGGKLVMICRKPLFQKLLD